MALELGCQRQRSMRNFMMCQLTQPNLQCGVKKNLTPNQTEPKKVTRSEYPELAKNLILEEYQEEILHLPREPSQTRKKEPSLLNVMPFGNWMLFRRTVVCFVTGSYFKTLPPSSPEKTNCMKFLQPKH